MQLRTLLIIVNYNQEEEIAAFLTDLSRYHPRTDAVVVDDGSTDRSPLIALELGFKLLAHENNRGVGAALRTGLHHALDQGYECAAVMSSNGKMKPSNLAGVLAPLQNGTADYVSGSRFMNGGESTGLGFGRSVAIRAFSLAVRPLLGRKFTDITCGFRAYRLDFLREGRLDIDQPWLDRYEMEYYIHYAACRTGLRMKEVPVHISYGHLAAARRSKIPPVSGWWSMVRPFILLSLAIKRRPR